MLENSRQAIFPSTEFAHFERESDQGASSTSSRIVREPLPNFGRGRCLGAGVWYPIFKSYPADGNREDSVPCELLRNSRVCLVSHF